MTSKVSRLPAERVAAGTEVRAAAARLNARIMRDGTSLDTALADPVEISGRDQSLLRAFAYGTLRWHHRLQWQLEQLLSRPLTAKDTELGALLRLGLFQLQWLRIPDHAAVSATVDATATLGIGRARGLVNAVLRRFLRERTELELKLAEEPSALFSHPRWLIEQLKHDWFSDWQTILDANNEAAPMWLRVNARRLSRDQYRRQLADAGVHTATSDLLNCGLMLCEAMPTSELPGYDDGLVSVQDGAAQLAPGFLNLRAGHRVLDACAAPGGKTAHILESCPELGEVQALDRNADRLTTVQANLDRLGLAASLLHADAGDVSSWWDGQLFDRILVDAPCTASGVIRRHPDIKLLRQPSDVAPLIAQQRRLLVSLWPLLKQGGRMLYATCSVFKQENHGQLEQFVEQTTDAVHAGPEPGRHYQRLPGEANMDGFYYACIDKQAI